MSVFNNYAQYYDLLYRDKDYAGEAAFIHRLIQQYASGAQTILEFGCGTGKHAELFAQQGYTVHGIDRSADMLQQAQHRRTQLPEPLAARLRFSHDDLRTLQLSGQFDVVLALFHVLSYQTSNEDVEQTFATARAHLKSGGLFVFDYWYGPAVLHERPVVRVKRLEDDQIRVIRIAEPALYANENLVAIQYHVVIQDKVTAIMQELQETHTMRYLFQPEIESFLTRHQFTRLIDREWMTMNEPGITTWGVYTIGKAL